MQLTIQRSAEYVAARRVQTGENVSDIINVLVDPARLSLVVRAAILEANNGRYPDHLYNICLDMDRNSVSADLEADEATAETIADLLERCVAAAGEKRAARLDAERIQMDAEQRAITEFLSKPEARITRRDSGDPYWIEYAGVRIRTQNINHDFRDEALRREKIDAEAKKARADQESAAKLSVLCNWAKQHGSERLKLMLTLAAGDWAEVARREFMDAHAPDGYTYGTRSGDPRKKPTLAELQELKRLRDLCEKSNGVLSDPTIDWVVEESEYDDETGEQSEERRYAVAELKVHSPDGDYDWYNREIES
ncbi:MAG TPA: hypothetical protein VGA88_08380 [Burkholderiales bacterium]